MSDPLSKSSRGGWYVVAQIVLMALVLFGPRGEGGWRFLPTMFGTGFGLLLILSGAVLLCAGIAAIGDNRTPMPRPRENSTLVTTGPYRIVRHPMYGGGLLIAFGWALCVHSWLTLGYAVILFGYIDFKARREELWLAEKFPNYAAFQKRVKKLIPYIY